ncbi:MAG: XRE family transcriptional regulator [Fervidobacterium sp.]|nr:XRE family transcriptional regulator [Fervidobacterium sp.]
MNRQIGERIRQARLSLGLSQAELAKLVGVSERTIRNYESGEIKKPHHLHKIAKVLKVSPDWLLKGVGTLPEKQEISPTAVILYYPNVVVSAGFGAINENEESIRLYIDKALLELLNIHTSHNLILVRVSGDSMEPLISHGDYIIVERTQKARNGEVIIANINGEVYVKKLLKDPFGRWVRLTSTNPYYPDIELKGAEIESLKVIGVIRAKIKPF